MFAGGLTFLSAENAGPNLSQVCRLREIHVGSLEVIDGLKYR